MNSTRDPDRMSETERLDEFADLLAAAILRVRSRPQVATPSSAESGDSSARPLEVSDATRLSVTHG